MAYISRRPGLACAVVIMTMVGAVFGSTIHNMVMVRGGPPVALGPTMGLITMVAREGAPMAGMVDEKGISLTETLREGAP